MTMPRILPTIAACLAIAAGAMAPGPAAASGRDENQHGRDDDRGPPERTMSLDEAMAQAEKRYRARAVHGEEKRQGDRIVYRIRLLDKDGRVFEVSIDAGSGRDR